ncbi:MAG: sulfonate transport system permease protein [Actinomycetota bacterium]|nr:sulfonate transport system permease protein [Actinomycetota bacterium]
MADITEINDARPAPSAPGASQTPGAPRARSASRAPRAAGPAWTRWALRAGSPVAALLVWQLLTANHVQLWLRFDKLPTVVEVATAFRQQVTSGIYYDDLFGSLRRITTGFTLAAAVGVALGVLVSRSPVASDLLRPVLEVIRPIPAIALVPVAILLFPENEQGIVFITFLAAFFPVLVSTMHTVRALPTIWEDAVRTMGGGRLRVLWHVVLPGSLPGIFGGLSVAIGVAWICVISAEMISGESGVGYRTWQAYSIVDYPNVIVGMLSIGVLGFLTAAGLELLGRRVTSWLPQRVEGAS